MKVYFRCSATQLHKINKGHKSQMLIPFLVTTLVYDLWNRRKIYAFLEKEVTQAEQVSEGLDLSDGCVSGGILPLVRTERKGKEVGGDRYSGPQHLKNLYHQWNLQLLQRAIEKMLENTNKVQVHFFTSFWECTTPYIHLFYPNITPLLHPFKRCILTPYSEGVN